uniref:ATP synthase complex subunit 8 n=1 Tax=Temnopleurus hardwickii TaxID=39384 RepID=A0A0U1Y9E2_TEMHA|nr:ATP synthase F0 subunit 8 [Temnopleurus hardwickii]AJC10788.1 ATP synthase F0 subunit 8 [Temnopleurus hardwickii]
MPQLDFVWWVINFIIVWIALIAVLTTLLNSKEETNISESSSANVNKQSTTWQWV